jgi:cell division protein FtsL
MKSENTIIDEQQTATETAEHRYVYNGEAQRPGVERLQRGNRPVRKRKRSPFNIVVILFAVSIVIVLYIWNKITVNRLVVEVADENAQYESILHANDNLRAEVSKRSTLERVGKIATTQLGMTSPSVQPVWFAFDDQRLSKLDN